MEGNGASNDFKHPIGKAVYAVVGISNKPKKHVASLCTLWSASPTKLKNAVQGFVRGGAHPKNHKKRCGASAHQSAIRFTKTRGCTTNPTCPKQGPSIQFF